MRKNRFVILIAIGIALIVIGAIIFMFLKSTNESEIGQFDLAQYQWEIETFPSDENVGQVNDANTAIEKAKELWIEKFSIIGGQSYNPINGIKIEVSYDSDSDCWHINSTQPSNVLGGVLHAIIRKNGEVVAVWFED
jgi:hypothetical protein